VARAAEAGRAGLARSIPLLFSARLDRSAVIEPGRAGAYFALFSEIGLILLVTTLGGSLGGHWLDQQLGLGPPLFLILGLLGGLAAGALVVYRLITRFLASTED
jgi:hypothetical protein